MSDIGAKTVQREPDQADWDRIAASREFKDLIELKRAFIVPALVIFLLYHFALPVMVGYAPRLASTRIAGTLNVVYLFALSQFVVGWIIAGLYLLAATKFDALSRDLLELIDKPQRDR